MHKLFTWCGQVNCLKHNFYKYGGMSTTEHGSNVNQTTEPKTQIF
uniref:Uncharacterized protein n=1 Tax=Rhizophora mucronata TaxID=61149 RepID=A0A2P2NJQ5_RHIMU